MSRGLGDVYKRQTAAFSGYATLSGVLEGRARVAALFERI